MPFREVELYQHNLETAAASALDLLSEIIGVDTLFVATNDGKTNHIIKALNRDQKLVEEGSSLPFFDTYCSLVVTGLDPVLVIPDTSDSTLTCSMEVTKTLGPTSFIGVPIILPNGEPVGTICGMDRHGYQFTSRDQELLKRVAKLFSYVAGLERIAYRDGLTGAYSREFLYTKFAKTFKDTYILTKPEITLFGASNHPITQYPLTAQSGDCYLRVIDHLCDRPMCILRCRHRAIRPW